MMRNVMRAKLKKNFNFKNRNFFVIIKKFYVQLTVPMTAVFNFAHIWYPISLPTT